MGGITAANGWVTKQYGRCEREAKLIFCVVGIYVTFIYYGYLQERLYGFCHLFARADGLQDVGDV